MSLYFSVSGVPLPADLIMQQFQAFGPCSFNLYEQYGFVEYQTRYDAENAKRSLSGMVVNGVPLEVEWNYITENAAYKAENSLSNWFEDFTKKKQSDGIIVSKSQHSETSMSIEDDEDNKKEERKNEDKKAPLSTRERLSNAMQNGIESDSGPRDASFALLFLNANLTEIISKYVFEYYRNQAFKQVLFTQPADSDATTVILEDLKERIKKEDSFINLLASVINHFAASENDKYSIELLANDSLSSKLEWHYPSFIRTKMLENNL